MKREKQPKPVCHPLDPRVLQPDLVKDLAEEIRDLLFQTYHLRHLARCRMYDIQLAYNRTFRHVYLGLRPWIRRRGHPPYTLCWVRILGGRIKFDSTYMFAHPLKTRWPFRRLIIRKPRDLDTAIHRCQLDARRKEIFSFHRQVLAVNQACRLTTRALSLARKILSGHMGDRHPTADPNPRANPIRRLIPSDLLRLADRHHNFTKRLSQERFWLFKTVEQFREDPLHPRLSPVLVRDNDHPLGRVLWRSPVNVEPSERITETHRRRLRLGREERRRITEFQRTFLSLARSLARHVASLHKMRARLIEAAAAADLLKQVTVPAITKSRAYRGPMAPTDYSGPWSRYEESDDELYSPWSCYG